MEVEKKFLVVLDLHVLAAALQKGFEKNYKNVAVKVGKCPDLSQRPYNSAAPGICGHTALVDVGGTNNLNYPENRPIKFNIGEVAKAIGKPQSAFIGPGAGYRGFIEEKVNCELIATTNLPQNLIRSKYSIVSLKDKSCVLRDYPTLDFGLMGNFLASDGQCGEVLDIKVSHRTGSENFVTCMRKTLVEAFPEHPMALGGVLHIAKGKVKGHVMPDFPEGPMLDTKWIENDWLVYYPMSAPLTCMSVFATQDLGLDLRMEHTHFYSEHGEGGHYHNDITPEEVEYHGWYVPCEEVFRVARHKIPPGYPPK